MLIDCKLVYHLNYTFGFTFRFLKVGKRGFKQRIIIAYAKFAEEVEFK